MDSEKYPKNIAPVSHRAFSPAQAAPEVLLSLYDSPPPAPGKLPSAFALPQIAHVAHEETKEGMRLVRCYGRLGFIGDVSKAIAAIQADANAQPMLFLPDDIAFGFTLALDRVAKLLGVNLAEKAAMVCTEVLPYADFAAFLGITPRAPSTDGSAATPFANGFFMHVPKTVKVCSARVSEEWAIQQLARGDTRGSRYRQPAGTTVITSKAANGQDMPLVANTNLAIDGYAAASEQSFDFANEKLPGNMTGRTYHVVCPGVAKAIEADEAVATDAETGENVVKQLSGGLEGTALAEWIDLNAVVYCLAAMEA